MKINIKSKKFIILFSIIFIILIFTITLISVLVMRSEHTGLLYYESQLNFNGSYTTSELSAQYNGGNNIRAWFNNYSKQDVNETISHDDNYNIEKFKARLLNRNFGETVTFFTKKNAT